MNKQDALEAIWYQKKSAEYHKMAVFQRDIKRSAYMYNHYQKEAAFYARRARSLMEIED